jgi:DNA repair protein RadC
MENLIIAKAFKILVGRLRTSTISFTEAELVEKFLLHKLIQEEHEVFGVLWLDVKNRLIAIDDIARGSVVNVKIFPRDLVKSAIRHNAVSAIFYHNHPSGDPIPSAKDRAMTAEMKQVLKLVDVHVLDHIIVAGAKTFSFARQGEI